MSISPLEIKEAKTLLLGRKRFSDKAGRSLVPVLACGRAISPLLTKDVYDFTGIPRNLHVCVPCANIMHVIMYNIYNKNMNIIYYITKEAIYVIFKSLIFDINFDL